MEYYEVESLVSRRVNPDSGYSEYLVKWAGYDFVSDDFHPRRNLDTIGDMVRAVDADEEVRVEEEVLRWSSRAARRSKRRRAAPETSKPITASNLTVGMGTSTEAAASLSIPAIAIYEPSARRQRVEQQQLQHRVANATNLRYACSRTLIDTVPLGECALPLLPPGKSAGTDNDPAERLWRSHHTTSLTTLYSQERFLTSIELDSDVGRHSGPAGEESSAYSSLRITVVSIMDASMAARGSQSLDFFDDGDDGDDDDDDDTKNDDGEEDGETATHRMKKGSLGEDLLVLYRVDGDDGCSTVSKQSAGLEDRSRADSGLKSLPLCIFRACYPQELLDFLLGHSIVFAS